MRRAFVGFSSPISYSYKNNANKTRNDETSSPNPVLYGSMGLLTLYDEIWFACESLCPNAMRHLPYVKFLDQHGPILDLIALDFKTEVNRIYNNVSLPEAPCLNDMFEGGFSDGMTKYIGAQLATDNHTHGLDFMGEGLGGNPGLREMICDMWLLSRNKNLAFELVLNPLTAQLAFSTGVDGGAAAVKALGLAERVLTFGSFYDITGPDGPYHECVEELRQDGLLQSFRNWMDNQRTRLDNQEIATIETEVNHAVREYSNKALRNSVKPQFLSNVAVKIAKDEIIGKLPGGSILSTVSEAVSHNREAEANQWKVFIALAQARLDDVRPSRLS